MTPTEIANLDPLQFRRFVTDLLMNEVLAYGGRPDELTGNPGDVPDGGQDALTNRPARAGDGTDFFVPLGETVWQFKAEAGSPTPAEFRNEIVSERRRGTRTRRTESDD